MSGRVGRTNGAGSRGHGRGVITRPGHPGGSSLRRKRMGSGYIFSLQPTFTQGFILGQISILALLAVVIKYLFLETEPARNVADRTAPVSQPTRTATRLDGDPTHIEPESTEWLNALLHQVCRYY
jgi:maintenance of morphology protein 1